MRAGAFAESRIIRLINRRFVPFYFNTGGPGRGKDRRAARFVRGHSEPVERYNNQRFLIQEDGGMSNLYAYFSAFGPGEKGGLLGIANAWHPDSDVDEMEQHYPSKETIFQFLVDQLKQHPEYNRYTKEEEAILEAARSKPDDPAANLAAAMLEEDLAKYDQARTYFRQVLAHQPQPEQMADAHRGLMRIARYTKKWDELEQTIAEARKADQTHSLGLGGDMAAEWGYRQLAAKQYSEARESLSTAIKRFPKSKRMGELRFYTGVACFFLDDIDWAYFHWCWVVENIPEDHLSRRCYIAAAHESFPYPNFELGGFRSERSVGTQDIAEAYEDARSIYEELMEELR